MTITRYMEGLTPELDGNPELKSSGTQSLDVLEELEFIGLQVGGQSEVFKRASKLVDYLLTSKQELEKQLALYEPVARIDNVSGPKDGIFFNATWFDTTNFKNNDVLYRIKEPTPQVD